MSYITDSRRSRIRTSLARILRLTMTLPAMAFAVGAAQAANINGVWVTNAAACGKMVVKKGKQTVLAPDSDLYGSGFVVDGSVIRGKIATCKITSRKDDGATIHLTGTCATDITVTTNQLDIKMVDDNTLFRMVPGIPELDTLYYRCPP